jgi:hypothetical protein
VRAQDAIMLTLYLLAFAMGIQMAIHGENLGYVQVAFISVLFPFRLALAIKRICK